MGMFNDTEDGCKIILQEFVTTGKYEPLKVIGIFHGIIHLQTGAGILPWSKPWYTDSKLPEKSLTSWLMDGCAPS